MPSKLLVFRYRVPQDLSKAAAGLQESGIQKNGT